jgi:hypothetical protein
VPSAVGPFRSSALNTPETSPAQTKKGLALPSVGRLFFLLAFLQGFDTVFLEGD